MCTTQRFKAWYVAILAFRLKNIENTGLFDDRPPHPLPSSEAITILMSGWITPVLNLDHI